MRSRVRVDLLIGLRWRNAASSPELFVWTCRCRAAVSVPTRRLGDESEAEGQRASTVRGESKSKAGALHLLLITPLRPPPRATSLPLRVCVCDLVCLRMPLPAYYTVSDVAVASQGRRGLGGQKNEMKSDAAARSRRTCAPALGPSAAVRTASQCPRPVRPVCPSWVTS